MATPAPREAPTKSGKRYGNGPKIQPAARKDDSEHGVAPTGAAKEAARTAAGGVTEGNGGGAASEADVMAGTDGIPVTDRHKRELEDMGARHGDEMADMHKRHKSEQSALYDRHGAELAAPAAGEPPAKEDDA